MALPLLVKYHDKKYGQLKRLEKIEKGAWIDVYAAKEIEVPSLFKRVETIQAYQAHLEKLEEYFVQTETLLMNTTLDEGTKQKILQDIRTTFDAENQYYLDSTTELYKPTLVPLGFSCRLPLGYEAHLAPRSSSFKFFNFVQTNSVGVIDPSYCGNNDEYFLPVLTLYRNVIIEKNDKIAQFRIMEVQPDIEFIEVEDLESPDRGGHGSTGKQ